MNDAIVDGFLEVLHVFGSARTVHDRDLLARDELRHFSKVQLRVVHEVNDTHVTAFYEFIAFAEDNDVVGAFSIVLPRAGWRLFYTPWHSLGPLSLSGTTFCSRF